MGDLSRHVKTRTRSLKLKLMGLILSMTVLAGAAGVYFFVLANLAPASSDSTVDLVSIEIPKGASTARIGQVLAEGKVIRDGRFFALYARYKRVDGSFRSGRYSLSPNQALDSIIQSLLKGPAPDVTRILIPEGYNTKQIADLLEQNKLIVRERFFQAVRTFDFKLDFLQGLPSSDLRLEGFLFPATYEIEKGASEEQILAMMLKRFEQELTPEIRQGAAQKGWSIPQLVTMASLIEKEAQKEEDRPIISEVFQKRLKIGMPLQSCASIQFLLGYPKPVLTYKDLEIKSPYNTYQNTGLPPGPIANPGKASLRAAAFPANTGFLYFVAKPDGYHAFAKTYSEHLNNVSKYQQR